MPTLNLTEPTQNQHVRGTFVPLKGTAAGAGGTEHVVIDSVTVGVDGQTPIGVDIAPAGSNPPTVSFSTSVQVPPGQHQVIVTATDSNMVSVYKSVPVIVFDPCLPNVEFKNRAGNVSITPYSTCIPESLDEIVAMIRQAEADNRRVHAFGSAWSFSRCATTPDYLVDMSHLNRPIQTVQQALSVGVADSNLVYHVEAGITIRDLNRLLDSFHDPRTGNARRLALETLPGSSGQTLAGAISTGTHGGDRLFQLVRYMPPLADSVLAIHLVGAGGAELWIEPTRGITEPSLLRQFVIPGVDPGNIIYDDTTFDAVLVSLGCMGIIYSVVLRVRDQYGLIETTSATTWQRFKQTAVARYFNDPANRFLEVVLDPYTDSNGQNLCLVITRQEGDVTGMGACSAGDVKKAVTDMVHDDMGAISWSEAKHVGKILDPQENPDGDDITRMVQATNYILEQATDLRPVLAQDYGKIMRAVYPPTTCGGDSYVVMDIEYRGGPSSTSVYSIEMFFPALDPGGNLAFTGFVDALVSTINARTDTFLVGWVAMRFTGGTRASLGMQQWGQTCAVEVSTGAGVDGLLGLLTYILELMYRYGGIPHWGQLIDLNGLPGHGSIYSRFQEWRDVYGRMSNNFTVRTFENDLSTRWQLTSPPPVIMPVKIPDLQGQDLPSAQQLVRQLGLELHVTFVVTPNDINWNVVISQRPLAGVPVPPGTAINVVVGRKPTGPPL